MFDIVGLFFVLCSGIVIGYFLSEILHGVSDGMDDREDK
jgi:hypothetical protein